MIGLKIISSLDNRRVVVAASPPAQPVANAVEPIPRSPPGRHKIDVFIKGSRKKVIFFGGRATKKQELF